MMKRSSVVGLFVVSVAVAVSVLGADAQRPGENVAPRFEVDAAWPKPLPHRWLMGQASGVAVDPQNNIWVVQRPKSLTEDERGAAVTPPRSLCCVPAPPVLQFDAEGNLLQSWGGPGAGYEWPENEHGIYVDHQNNVWLAGNGAKDSQLLKFTRDGKFILQIGKHGQSGGDTDTQNLGRPANMVVDRDTNELFVADGYGNHRVIVFDAQTGAYKRHWGANGRPPGDSSVKQFGNVHCVRISRDGLVYVCDRPNNRIQVFRKDGTFVRELSVAPATRGTGSTWDVDLSHDAAQTWLYDADGENNTVWTLVRDSGKLVARLGRNGRSAGQFHWIHNMAVDAKGNIYTTEVDSGKRAQRFVYKGTAPVAESDLEK
jgi:DNA-binding beta-propeller fold protein YncE